MPVTPKLKSYLIADMVFRQDNGKWCIIGVFDKIAALKYPVIHPSLGIFLQLTDAEGEYQVGVQFRDASDRPQAILPMARLVVKDRLAIVGFGMQTRQLVIPAPGKYRFCLSFNGDSSDDIPLEAVEVAGGKANPEEVTPAVQEMEQRDSVGQPNPVEVTPSETAEFGAVRNMWLTPGSYLFREVASRPEILAIVERVEPERHCVIVALRSDPNDLLDRIFNAEREMFQVLRRVPFDLRVTVPDTEDTLQSILKSGIVHHLRR